METCHIFFCQTSDPGKAQAVLRFRLTKFHTNIFPAPVYLGGMGKIKIKKFGQQLTVVAGFCLKPNGLHQICSEDLQPLRHQPGNLYEIQT